jgi:cold shock CspA family protein
VRWKGSYGFIIPLNEGGKGKIFVHQSNLEMQGYRELFAGDLVEFERAEGERGVYAAKVRLIQSADPRVSA